MEAKGTPAYLIDTNIFLNVLRKEEPYVAASCALLLDVETRKVGGLISTITMSEILVGAYRVGSAAVRTVNLALNKLENAGLTFIPVDKRIAHKGAEIRASYKLKLPDALIAATAILNEAQALISRDKQMYATIAGLRVATPEEIGY